MDIRHLEIFVRCAELGSMSRAAETLYTTQPSVSYAVSALERELGANLFIRSGRGLRLTETGKQVYDQALNVLKSVAVMDAAAQAGQGPVLSLATVPSTAMADLFVRFFSKPEHHGAHCRYLEGSVDQIVEWVSSRTAEAGFLLVPEGKLPGLGYVLNRSRLRFRSFLTADMVVSVGPKHPLYNAGCVSPEQLLGLRFVQSQDDIFTLGDVIASALPKTRLPECAVRTNSDHAMMRLLSESDLCNIGSYLVRRGGDPRIRSLTVTGYEGKIRFGCVTPASEGLSEIAARFVAFVESAVRESGDILNN